MENQIKALFPLKGRVTEEIIKNSDPIDWEDCPGANTFREAIGDKLPQGYCIKWTNTNGAICREGTRYDVGIIVTTVEGVGMLHVKEPQDVTFILKGWDG
jgi:hypothetical protein